MFVLDLFYREGEEEVRLIGAHGGDGAAGEEQRGFGTQSRWSPRPKLYGRLRLRTQPCWCRLSTRKHPSRRRDTRGKDNTTQTIDLHPK